MRKPKPVLEVFISESFCEADDDDKVPLIFVSEKALLDYYQNLFPHAKNLRLFSVKKHWGELTVYYILNHNTYITPYWDLQGYIKKKVFA